MTPSPTTRALTELAERCEKATGPDSELDAEIYNAVVIVREHKCYVWHELNGRVRSATALEPSFVTSMDAAMQLVGDKDFGLRRDCRGVHAIVWNAGRNVGFDAEAPTAARALTAAALRARGQSQGD